MLNAIARALFGNAAIAPAFAGPAPRIASTAAPLRLVQAPTQASMARTGGERPEAESLDTPLAWADFPRGF